MKAFAEAQIILLAEDDVEDQLLIKQAMGKCLKGQRLQFVENGEDVMDYLHRRGKFAAAPNVFRPSLILLDLKMPRKDGKETLREIKADPELRAIPVVIMTTSAADGDVRALYALGANSYITKPARFKEWIDIFETIVQYWFGLVALPAVDEREG